ncbi:hypothetical protein BH10BDE1_BH10BDE1_35080 [soil metagenome]
MDGRGTVRLLIVDDEAELREILAEQLRDLNIVVGGVTYGVEIQEAIDGRDALEKFHETKFDAVLTDINMPEMTGLELLAALRGEGSDIPSIILTGFGDKSKAAEALRLGCFAFMDKPWKGANLRKTVLGALERGVSLRPLNSKVDARVEAYASESESRQRQLRTVFRSMLVGDDGSHRSDVCKVPTDKSNKKTG